MIEPLSVIMLTALTLGLVHTAIGPDHYLPFVVLGRSEGWTLRRTLFVTFICGLAHVLSSVTVGALGIGLGWSLSSMEGFEGTRGDVAIYTLMGFGALYMLYGLIRAGHGHSHVHVHKDGTKHVHAHSHSHPPRPVSGEQAHVEEPHDQDPHVRSHKRTFWALFIVFVLGPCEPLIPLLMVPASSHSIHGILSVSLVFSAATIGTMLLIVTLGYLGIQWINFGRLERYAHALSGGAILLSGSMMKLFGL